MASGNNAADKAVDVAAGTTVSGRIEANNFDYFRLNLKQGERVLIDVAAERHRFAAGRHARAARSRRPRAGAGQRRRRRRSGARFHRARRRRVSCSSCYDAVYGGGNDYFYRLTVSAAPFVDFVFPPSGPAGSTQSIHALRPQSAGRTAGRRADDRRRAAGEAAGHHSAASGRGGAVAARDLQRLRRSSGPGRMASSSACRRPPARPIRCRSISPSRRRSSLEAGAEQRSEVGPEDRRPVRVRRPVLSRSAICDWVEFDAKKGQTYWIEVISSQLGLASDPVVRDVSRDEERQGRRAASEIAQVDDTPERGRRRSAPTISTPRATTRLTSSSCRKTARIACWSATSSATAARTRRSSIACRSARPSPIFACSRIPVSPPANAAAAEPDAARLGQRSPRRHDRRSAWSLQRRDEFAGEIAVSVEGLPPGVTCAGAVLGGGVDEGSLVLVAADDASAWAGPIKVIAKGKIGEPRSRARGPLRRRRLGHAQSPAAAGASSAWRPALSLGVIDKDMEPALVQIGEDKVYETSLGGNVEIPIKITRRGDFKDAVKLVGDRPRPADAAQGRDARRRPRRGQVGARSQPAEHQARQLTPSICRARSKRKYARNPDAVTAAEAEQKRLAEMIKAHRRRGQIDHRGQGRSGPEGGPGKAQGSREAQDPGRQAARRRQKGQPAQGRELSPSSARPSGCAINASPIEIKSAAADGRALKPGSKQELAVSIERSTALPTTVELTLEPPAGVRRACRPQKVTLKKDEAQASWKSPPPPTPRPASTPAPSAPAASSTTCRSKRRATVTVTVADERIRRAADYRRMTRIRDEALPHPR